MLKPPPPLFHWNNLPRWAKDNDLIDTHYRTHTRVTTILCLKSVFQMHNETINIWTHMVGFFYFLVVFARMFSALGPEWILGDIVAWACFAVSCLFMMFCSTAFHIFMNHSEDIYRRTVAFDYVGIIALAWGHIIVATRFMFWCNTTIQVYIIVPTTTLCASVIGTIIVPKYATPEYRNIRTAMFASVGACGLVPLAMFTARNTDDVVCFHIMQKIWTTKLMYLVGAFVYITRFPECVFPGKVNLYFASHQILHLCGFFGCTLYYTACRVATTRVHAVNFSC